MTQALVSATLLKRVADKDTLRIIVGGQRSHCLAG